MTRLVPVNARSRVPVAVKTYTLVFGESPAELVRRRVPPETVVAPEKVLMPERTQVPAPDLVNATTLAPLSAMTAARVLGPVLLPVKASVRVLLVTALP